MALLVVTWEASGYCVFPGVSSSESTWIDVINGHSHSGFSTVLACCIVSADNSGLRPRLWLIEVRNFNVSQHSDDFWVG